MSRNTQNTGMDDWDNYWEIRRLKGQISKLRYEKIKSELEGGCEKKKKFIKLSTILKLIIVILLTFVILSISAHMNIINLPSFIIENPIYSIVHTKVGEMLAPLTESVTLYIR